MLGTVSAAASIDLLAKGLLPGSKAAHAAELAENPLIAGRPLVRYPQKTELILLTSRPPQLETPMKYFETAITPNDAFYVRYHIYPPADIDVSQWRLRIGGQVEQELQLSIDDLRNGFPRTSIVAVNQCSGNSRGYSSPRVFGGQWANGAMGNAEWTGVRLRDILSKARVKQGAVDVTFDGLDKPQMPSVPDFVKSLSISHAIEDPNVLVAYEMNEQPLPLLNGFPARLIVPGWYATYWVKNLSDINVLDHPFDGFWMTKAYLIPDTPCGCIEPGAAPAHSVPINRMNVRSFLISIQEGARVPVNRETILKGIAFDAGYGIQDVFVSTNSGATWQRGTLGRDWGNYSFREWSFNWTPRRPGKYVLMVRAVNRVGESQPDQRIWNPAGYMQNFVERVSVSAA
jgi:DMSO/TMAO reductase YedYZ molybdopterin-dependent catalytic subunit